MTQVTISHPDVNTLKELKDIYVTVWSNLPYSDMLSYIYGVIYSKLEILQDNIQYSSQNVIRGHFLDTFENIEQNVLCQVDETFTEKRAKKLIAEVKNNLSEVYAHTYGKKLFI